MKNLQTYEEFLNESKSPLKFKVYVKEGEVTEIEVLNSEIFEEDEEDQGILDIKIEIEDEDGNDIEEYREEDESVQEKAKPPRLTPKQRKANAVKAAATKKVLGQDSPIRAQINKIFMLVKKQIKKEAAIAGVPVGNINLDKLTIRA